MTFMTAPTAYSVQGNVSSFSGLHAASAYLQQMTGGQAMGSIRVNDTRRPITKAYTDRFLGEY